MMYAQNTRKLQALTLACGLLACTVSHADGYLQDSRGEGVRSGDGQCVRSSFWKAEPLVPGCDPMPVPVAKVPMPARIILLPDPNGKAGAVVVRNPAGEQLLNKAYAGLEAPQGGALQPKAESAESVKARYGDLLAAQPRRPETFIVRFQTGSATQLTQESSAVVETLKKALPNWPAAQLMVVGHTDRVGAADANDKLSLKRAETVAEFLSGQGIPAARIETAGRGEREPIVPTADGVAEAANRRVEITVR